MKTVSATEANRSFAKLLGDVKKGETVVITSHGTPVAQLAPPGAVIDDLEARRAEARRILFERLRNQPALNLGRVSRDELYDDTDDFA